MDVLAMMMSISRQTTVKNIDKIVYLILVCITDTNPNYFSDRDQSCGNVRLDYTIHTWESPDPAVAAQSRTKTSSSSSDSGKEIKNSVG